MIVLKRLEDRIVKTVEYGVDSLVRLIDQRINESDLKNQIKALEVSRKYYIEENERLSALIETGKNEIVRILRKKSKKGE